MSMIERILFWISIVVLLIGIVGMKVDVSKLEKKVHQTVQASSEGGEE
ncbi:hypothetical protein [Persephonella atlantica]|nr:hypothetical protein [Persephonella atlantica]